ncbi:sporulation inhibitor of replication protein SirA [Ectobacillus ponti]|uniref:Sporulation inhibitor of replication protein SirA n=1 Tax=Ectobacillus ponti TaxID=2961894 RepID=A0AA42BQ72_9BACI|nr:sporulation inhibitor of replication protein SirA [Ectobacillus ponti]
MKTYHLYLMQHDIAKEYFGRESLLFDLFSRFTRSRSLAEKKVLYRQIKYVTKPLPALKLHHRTEQALGSHPGYRREGNTHWLWESGQAWTKLTLHRQYAVLESSGHYELEAMFFEVLRKQEATFLALNYENEQSGWLNPIRQERKYV